MAKEGLPFLVAALIPAMAAWAGWYWAGSGWMRVVALLLTVLTAFIAFFFRDPTRIPPDDPKAVVTPGPLTRVVCSPTRRPPKNQARTSFWTSP